MPAKTAERCNVIMDDSVYLYLNNNEMNVRFVVTVIINTQYVIFSTSFLFCDQVLDTSAEVIATQIFDLETDSFLMDSSNCDDDSSLLFASQISPDIICPINVLQCQVDDNNILL